MSTHLPGFQSFSGFLHHFVLAKVATSSIRVKKDKLLKINLKSKHNRYLVTNNTIRGPQSKRVNMFMLLDFPKLSQQE